jgi:hypothetical protein
VVGLYAWLDDRCVRIAAAPGWWHIRVRGRSAEPVRQAAAEEITAALAHLERVRGPVIRTGGGCSVVHGSAQAHAVDLAPIDEEPPLFAPLCARRWPIGDLVLWGELEWESEVEETARRALEDGHGLRDIKGVPASLRAAFAFATGQQAARALGIPAAPAELRRWVREIADGGRPAAEIALRALARERAEFAERVARAERAATRPAAPAPSPEVALDIEGAVEESLRGSGARLLATRKLAAELLEIRWMFMGERFISVVRERGLRVVDAGVCLAGSDGLVTLDALPGVIREAIEDEALVITRHDQLR